MKQLLFSPKFEDEDHSRRAGLTHVILLSMIFTSAFFVLPFAAFAPASLNQYFILALGVSAIGAILFVLLRRGFVSLANWVLVISLWGLATVAIFTSGGVRSPIFAAYIAIIVMAGLLLGGRVGGLWAGLSTLTGLGMVYAESNGALPSLATSHTPFAVLLFSAAFYSVVVVLQGLFARTSREALARARDELVERRRAESALRESEERFRVLLENGDDLIVVLDAEGFVQYASPATYRNLGYPSGNLPNQSGIDFLRLDDGRKLAEDLRKLLEQPGVPLKLSEYRLQTSQGSWFVVDMVAVNLLANPAVRGIVFNGFDVTSRKQVEAALAEQADEMAKLYRASARLMGPVHDLKELGQRIADIVVQEFEFAECGIWLPHEDGKVLYRLAYSGYAYEEIMEDIPLDGRGLTVAALRSGELVYVPDVSVDSRYLSGDPNTRSELVAPLPMSDRVIGVINIESYELNAFNERDRRVISALAERAALAIENTQLVISLERAVQRANDLAVAAEEASRLKGQFLTNTSHELRTPLAGIIGALDIVLHDMCSTKEEEREMLHLASESARNLTAIVDDLLEIAKIESGQIEIQSQITALGPIFDEVNALSRTYVGDKDLQVEFVVPSTPALLYADPDKLRRILLNLLGNAIKFTNHGRVTVAASHDFTASQLTITVEDTGTGIPLDAQSKLFQPFSQVDGSTTRRHGGTGLGLAIARRLAEMMGGTLSLFSDGVGRGTKFTLVLPMANLDS